MIKPLRPASPLTVPDRTLHFSRQPAPEGITVRGVRNLQEFYSGMRLLHQQYRRLGIITPQPGEMIFSPALFQHGSRLFIATRGNAVVGTIAYLRHGTLGIPAMSLYGEEIQPWLARGPVGEIGALCIEPSCRNQGVLRLLYAYAILYACVAERTEMLFIQVDRRKAAFYQKMFFFQPASEGKRHPAYGNLESMLMRGEIRPLLRQLRHSLLPAQRLSIRQLLGHLHILPLYQQLRYRMQYSRPFLWQADSVRDYCRQCHVSGQRISPALRRLLWQEWGWVPGP